MVKLKGLHPPYVTSFSQRRAYMKLPLEERRRHLAAQADRMVEHYEQAAERTAREAWNTPGK